MYYVLGSTLQCYLEYNVDIASVRVCVDEGELERNSVGVEERAGLRRKGKEGGRERGDRLKEGDKREKRSEGGRR